MLKFSPSRILAFVFSLFALSIGAGARAQDVQNIYTTPYNLGNTPPSYWRSGWEYNGWIDSKINKDDKAGYPANPKFPAMDAISVTGAVPYDGIRLLHDTFSSSPYAAVSFYAYGGSQGGQRLQVIARVKGVDQPVVKVLNALPAGKWALETAPLSQLGAANTNDFQGVTIQVTKQNSSVVQPFYLQDICLTPAPAPASVAVSVDAETQVRTVDDRFFGLNLQATDTVLTQAQTQTAAPAQTLLGTDPALGLDCRLLRFPGGNLSNEYDWRHDTFYNQPSDSTAPAIATIAQFGQVVSQENAQAMITVNYGSGLPEEAAALVAYCNGDPASTTPLGTDEHGNDWRTVGYWASLRAQSPLPPDQDKEKLNCLRVNHPQPWNFRYWEIGNENWGWWEYDAHGSTLDGQPYDPKTYADQAAVFLTKMRLSDPTIKVGIALTYDNTQPRDEAVAWNPTVLADLRDAVEQGLTALPDFVSQHWYPQSSQDLSDQGLFMTNGSIADAGYDWTTAPWDSLWNDQSLTWAKNAHHLRQQLQVLGPAASQMEMLVTENNSNYNSTQQMTALTNGLYLADSLGSALQTDYNGLVWWDFQDNPGTAAIDPSLYGWRRTADPQTGVPDAVVDFGLAVIDKTSGKAIDCYPAYYVSKMLRHFARGGDTVVAATTGSDLLSAYAVKHQDGTLSLLVINKCKPSTAAIRGTFTLNNFVPSHTATVYTYGEAEDSGQKDFTTTAFSRAGQTFSFTFAPYSATVLSLVPTAPILASVTAPYQTIGGSAPVVGMVTLTDLAPLGGLTVALTSSDPAAGVPATVTVPAGVMSIKFPITTSACAANRRVKLTATAAGVTKSTSLLVTAATPNFVLAASASPLLIATSGLSNLTVNVTNSGAAQANAIVDVEVDNSAGTQVSQQVFTGRSFPASNAQTFLYHWTAPAAPGVYTVKVGVFAPGSGTTWGPVLAWNDNAATITVTAPDTAQYGFETGTQGWTTSGGMIAGVGITNLCAWAGTHALAVKFAGTGADMQQVSVAAPPTPAGKVVTFHVWVPAGSNLISVQPYVQQGPSSNYLWTGNCQLVTALTPGAWNTITVAVPSGAVVPLARMGVQFVTGGAWSGVCYIDAVGW